MSAIEKLRARMQEMSVSAALVTNIANIHWLTGFSGSSGFAIVTEDGGVFITDSRYSEQAPEQVKGLPVRIYQSPKTSAEVIAESAKELGVKKLSFESEHVTFATHDAWKEKSDGIEFEPVKNLVDELRLIKSPEEIHRVREACGIADACFEHVTRMMQEGVREYDIALDIEFFIRRQGAKVAFPVIVVSGERSARPHGEPSEKKLEKGDFVTLDFGACVQGYNSDITRTVVIGAASDRHKEVYAAVLEAQTAAIDAIKPGANAKDVDALSREILKKYDLDKYFGHGLGHGLGSAVHDVGSLNPSSKNVLAPGQIWTVEPGVYIEKFGGVRIEDDVVVTKEGCDVLTTAPKELLVL